MLNARDALVTGSVYLGEPGVVNNVTWVHVGKADRLVTNETTTEYKSSSNLSATDPESFTLTNPDANWKGPSTVAPKLSNAKASCTGQAPDNEAFVPDFPTVINNIKDIIAKG